MLSQLEMDEHWVELHALLQDMDVPPDRMNDIYWLNRNLGIHHRTHPGMDRARELIRTILTEIVAATRRLNEQKYM